MSGGIDIERRDCDGNSSFLVWLISPMGDRILFHEGATYAEARACALEAVPIFGPLRRDDGCDPIQ